MVETSGCHTIRRNTLEIYRIHTRLCDVSAKELSCLICPKVIDYRDEGCVLIARLWLDEFSVRHSSQPFPSIQRLAETFFSAGRVWSCNSVVPGYLFTRGEAPKPNRGRDHSKSLARDFSRRVAPPFQRTRSRPKVTLATPKARHKRKHLPPLPIP